VDFQKIQNKWALPQNIPNHTFFSPSVITVMPLIAPPTSSPAFFSIVFSFRLKSASWSLCRVCFAFVYDAEERAALKT
jgi:hypothetical protein